MNALIWGTGFVYGVALRCVVGRYGGVGLGLGLFDCYS